MPYPPYYAARTKYADGSRAIRRSNYFNLSLFYSDEVSVISHDLELVDELFSVLPNLLLGERERINFWIQLENIKEK